MTVQREQFTNGSLGGATLATNMGSGDTTLAHLSFTPSLPTTGQTRIKVDSEYILITDLSATPWPISRGQEGSTAAAHTAGAKVTQVLTAGGLDHVVSVKVAGTLTETGRDLNFVSGATAALNGDGSTIDITITGGAGGGHTIQENGSSLPTETNLNFKNGVIASDDAANSATDINLDYGGSPANVGSAAAAGSSAQVSRADHVHTIGAGIVTDTMVASANKDGIAATPSMRTLGTGAQQAAAGNDSRLSDSRTPTAHETTHLSGGSDALSGNLDAIARVSVRKNTGATILNRRQLNLIEGAGMSVTLTDDSSNEKVDVKLAFAGGIAAAVAATVTHSVDQSVANNTATILAFDTENIDTDTFHDTITNNSRLTIPSGRDGDYKAVGIVSFAANASGVRRLEVLKNATTVVAQVQLDAASGGVATVIGVESPPLALVATDYLELRVYQNSGGALNAQAVSAYSPLFGLSLLATTSSGGSGHTIEANGVALPAETNLNFNTDFSVTDNSGSSATDVALATTGVTAATYGDATHSSQVAINSKGQVTSASSVAIQAMVASGASHAAGFVPDPGASAGTTKYLREDATWTVPPGGMTDPTTTKGDLIVHGASTTRLPVGADGTVLTADSTQTDGVKWGTALTNPMTTAGDLIIGGTAGAANRLAVGTAGQRLSPSGSPLSPVWEDDVVDINFVIDGGGATITTGMKGYIEINQALTITANTLLADQSGSIVVNVWKCTYTQFDAGATHPVAADKITASAPPTITTAVKSTDSTLTGWTTSVSAGDILAFNVDSVTSIQRVTLCLKTRKAA